MLKVLHLLPMNKMSGAERMALLICKNTKDVQSHVITGGIDLAEAFISEGITATTINFSLKKMPSVTKQLGKYMKEHQIDIVHAHDNIASLSAYLTKKRYGLSVKIVSHIHNCYPWLEGNGINKKIDAFIRPKYDFNIACGQTVYDYYQKHATYLKKHETAILSNAIDMNGLNNHHENQLMELREKFNIKQNETIIGYIGRFSEQKGIIPFIYELKDYKDQFNQCKFLMVGSGEQEDEVKQLIEKFGLSDLFIFTGFQTDVYPFYQLIDIFFLPSLYEGLPMVLLEAMASGLPVVSMNVGSISEAVIHQETGLLVEPRKHQQLVEALLYLKDNPKQCQQFSLVGANHIKDHFNLNQYNESLVSIYQRVVGQVL